MTLVSTAAKSAGAGGVTGATVAALGAGSDGKTALLRAGSSPYEYVPLTFDGTASKWVSPAYLAPVQANIQSLTTAGTSYAELTGSSPAAFRAWIPNHLDVYGAGLRLWVFVSSLVSNSGAGNTSSIRAALCEFANGDTGQSAAVATGADHSLQGTTAKFVIGSWEALTYGGTPTEQHGLLEAQVKVDAGTGTFVRTEIAYRWMST